MDNLNVMALIPARAGSKGLVDKNIRALGKHPLLSYSIAAAKVSKGIDRVIVSTDSQEYASIALKYGAEVPFLRPKTIAKDNSTDSEFFQHAFDWLQNKEEYIPELVVHLRPTTPLRETFIVDEAISYMKKNSHATALRSAYQTHLTPFKMFKECGEFMQPFLTHEGVPEFYNLPRQHFDDAYIPNGYVDILRPRILVETGLLHGPNIKLWKTPEVPDIDTNTELDRANNMLNKKIFNNIIEYLNSKI